MTSSILEQFVTLPVEGEPAMQAFTAQPKGGGAFPGILIFQEAFGVNHHIRSLVSRFAEQGYVAIAPEFYHRTAPAGFEANYGDFEAVRPHSSVLTTEKLEADIKAAYNWLSSQPQVKKDSIVCSGYCMGGRCSYIANSILPLKAAVSYYAGGMKEELLQKAAQLHGPMLFFWGGLDKHIPEEQRRGVTEALEKAGKKFVNVVVSDADHGFFCDERSAYNEHAAKEAWALTLSFLEQKLGKK